MFVENENLVYVFGSGAQEIPVANCNDRASLLRQHGEALVRDPLKVLGDPIRRDNGCPFRTSSAHLWIDIGGMKKISDWVLPSHADELYLLNQQFERFDMKGDDPFFYGAC